MREIDIEQFLTDEGKIIHARQGSARIVEEANFKTLTDRYEFVDYNDDSRGLYAFVDPTIVPDNQRKQFIADLRRTVNLEPIDSKAYDDVATYHIDRFLSNEFGHSHSSFILSNFDIQDLMKWIDDSRGHLSFKESCRDILESFLWHNDKTYADSHENPDDDTLSDKFLYRLLGITENPVVIQADGHSTLDIPWTTYGKELMFSDVTEGNCNWLREHYPDCMELYTKGNIKGMRVRLDRITNAEAKTLAKDLQRLASYNGGNPYFEFDSQYTERCRY